MAMKLTKEQMREAIIRVYGSLCSGEDESDILEEMGLSAEDYENIKEKMLEVKAQELKTKPVEYTYVQYIIEQMKNLRTLDDFIAKNNTDKKSTQSLVGAVRARSEILDRVIARGQEFGIIKKAPNRSEVVAGVLIAEMSNIQLKKEITSSLGSLNLLLKKYGDNSIINVTPGDLYRGKELPEAVLKKEEPKADDEIKVSKVSDAKKKKKKRKDKKTERHVVRKKE